MRIWPIALAILITATSAEAQVNAPKSALVPFTGIVTDSLKKPLANAEVLLTGTQQASKTGDDGRFTIRGVPAGLHHVTIRKIGYGQLDTLVTLGDSVIYEWRITLGRVATLDSVVVQAPSDPGMVEFESNRARGFGRFLTRDDLAKKEGLSLPAVMEQVGGVSIVRTSVGSNYITSKRAPTTGCRPPRPATDRMVDVDAAKAAFDDCLRRERLYYVPDQMEQHQGIARACYPDVYVDNMKVSSGTPTMPFDLSSYAPEQVQAIEWYESASQMPPKFSGMTARCGVLVIRLRKKR